MRGVCYHGYGPWWIGVPELYELNPAGNRGAYTGSDLRLVPWVVGIPYFSHVLIPFSHSVLELHAYIQSVLAVISAYFYGFTA